MQQFYREKKSCLNKVNLLFKLQIQKLMIKTSMEMNNLYIFQFFLLKSFIILLLVLYIVYYIQKKMYNLILFISIFIFFILKNVSFRVM